MRSQVVPESGHLDTNEIVTGQTMMVDFVSKNYSRSDRILFLDFFSPGIELLPYCIAIDDQKPPLLGALIHGGSWLDGDLQAGVDLISRSERVWFQMFDPLYVPSNVALRGLPPEGAIKARLCPWGLEHLDGLVAESGERVIDVVFPHRLSDDKGLDDFFEIASTCDEVSFVATTPSSKAKLPEDLASLPNVSLRTVATKSELFRLLAPVKSS